MFVNIKSLVSMDGQKKKKKVIKWMKMFRSSRPEVFCKKVILKHFGKFSGKNLQWNVFYQSSRSQGLSSEFCNIFNNAHRENCVLFSSVQERLVGCFWPFWCVYTFTQSIKFYYILLYYRYKEYRCLENVIHHIDWLLLPANFTAKFGLVFVLTLENAFS